MQGWGSGERRNVSWLWKKLHLRREKNHIPLGKGREMTKKHLIFRRSPRQEKENREGPPQLSRGLSLILESGLRRRAKTGSGTVAWEERDFPEGSKT